MKYFGYMDYKSNQNSKYANFYPKYVFEDDQITEIKRPEEEFPQHGNLSIPTNWNFELEDYIKNKEFFVVDLESDDITEHKNQYTGEYYSSYYQINFESLFKQDKVHSIDEYGVYPIVTCNDDADLDFSVDCRIELKEKFPINKYMTKAILFSKGKYYGPFEVLHRALDNVNIINYKVSDESYSLKCYQQIDMSEDPILYCSIDKYGERAQDFIYLNDSLFSVSEIDLMDEETLLKEFLKLSSGKLKTLNLSQTELNLLLDDFKNVKSCNWTDSEVVDNRFEKLERALSDVEYVQSVSNAVVEAIGTMLLDNENNPTIERLLEKITNAPSFLKNIQNYRIVEDKIIAAQNELQLLTDQQLSLKEEMELKKEKISEELINDSKAEYEKIRAEIQEKENELELLLEKHKLANDIDILTDKTNYLNLRREELNDQIKQLDDSIETRLNQLKKNLVQFDFNQKLDKLIASKLNEAYSSFESENTSEDIGKIESKLHALKRVDYDKTSFINELVDEVQYYRPNYDKNTILNLFICCTQGFLTIFSGEPGVGKTSACEIMANVLGLNNSDETSNLYSKRFVSITVERGWNSKRDLIGYYNPLTKSLEKANSNLFDALTILNYEGNSSDLPLYILLDEANLSPMEYYWAEFIGICDNEFKDNPQISIGGSESFTVPETVRFLATINNDHTTEPISPRLLDRAFVITLPDMNFEQLESNYSTKNNPPIVPWDLLNECFGQKDEEMTYVATSIFNQIIEMFKNEGSPISNRSINAIKSYCSSAQSIFEDSSGIDKSIVALDYAVLQKVIPKLSGSGSEYRTFLSNLAEYLDKQNLVLSSKKVSDIIKKGSMNYYNFFS